MFKRRDELPNRCDLALFKRCNELSFWCDAEIFERSYELRKRKYLAILQWRDELSIRRYASVQQRLFESLKSCEEINWFEHGQKVALRGQWLNADSTLNECRKVEADIQESQLDRGFKSGVEKYCTGTNTYILGKGGDLFSRDICEGPQINVLISEHQKGLRDYCAKSNGFTAGTSGKRYQNVCPKELESGFLPEYRKGRRKYVQSLIDSKDKQVRSIDMDITAKRNSLSFAKGSLHRLESQKSSLELQKNSALSSNQSYLVTHFEAQINSLDSDLSLSRSTVSNLESDIRSLESNRDKLNSEITSFREELPGLEQP